MSVYGYHDGNAMSPDLSPGNAEPPLFEPAVPILRIFSIDKAWEFYRDYLGFHLDWEHRFEPALPLYAQISRSGLRLHLSEHYGDGSPGAVVWIPIRDVRGFQAELTAKDYGYLRPGIDQDAPGGPTMELTDPFGNRLRLCQTG